MIGGSIFYGTSTLFGANVIDVSQIKIITNNNQEFNAYVQIKDFPINTKVAFEIKEDEDNKIELIQIK